MGNSPCKSKFLLIKEIKTQVELHKNSRLAVLIDGHISLKVYDILGREVSILLNEYKKAGYYEIKFDGSNLASGMYFYKIESGEFREVRKMVLIK